VLANDEDDVAGPGTFNRVGKPYDIEGIDRLVVGLGSVIPESLVMEHEPVTGLSQPTLLFRSPCFGHEHDDRREHPKAKQL
jgi:hypothetical protein